MISMWAGHARLIRVGYSGDFEPYCRLDKGRARGVLIEIIGVALQLAHLRARFIEIRDGDWFERLSERSIDAYAPLAVTPERRALAFSRPLLTVGAAWFVPRGTNA